MADDPIGDVEDALDRTARACLRLIGTRSLTANQHIRLAKWMYGCSNQRFTIRERVAKRGVAELEKVLQFIAKALTTIADIDNEAD